MTAPRLSSRVLRRHRAISRTLLSALAAAALLACFGAPASAPGAPASADDWLPVSPADLALKDNPKSPGAHAMILYRESMVDAKESRDDEYIRIKIFTKEGAKEGDVEIPFVKGEDDIKDVRARTIRPDGSIANFEGKPFEKIVVKASGIKILAKTFSLPDVQLGCIIEYKYRDQSDPNYYYNNAWTVQGDLFTQLARFSIKPDTSPGAPALVFRSMHLPENLKPVQQGKGIYTLEVRDLPGIEEEEYMPPVKALKARVEFFYPDRDAVFGESVQQYWQRIGRAWSASVDSFTNKKGALQTEISRILAPTDQPEAKLRKIYARVQQLRNLSMEDSKTEKEEKHENLKGNDNVEDVLKHGYGNARQINYLFVGLARAAGFESSAAFVAPRSDDFFNPASKDASELHADLVWVRSGSQEYFLDPGARYYLFGSLPWYETGTRGIRVSSKGFDDVTTPVSSSSDSISLRHADLTLDASGDLTGTIDVDFNGQTASFWRADYRDEDEAGRKQSLETSIKSWLPQGCAFDLTKIANWDDFLSPLHVEGTVKESGYANALGRRLLLPVEFFQSSETKAFQNVKRVNDVYFHFPYEDLDDVKLHLPASFRMESSPTVQNVDSGAVKYQISVETQGNSLEIKRHMVLNLLVVSVNNYSALKTFFTTVKKNDDAEVVLTNAGDSKGN
jgi:hypothetical protein